MAKTKLYDLVKMVLEEQPITRARRKIQQLHPELQTDNILVQKKRENKMATKGAFIYKETV